MAKATPKFDHTTVVVNLHVELTESELADRAHECAKLIDELDKSETEFKEIKKEWNTKHKELKTEIRELSLAHVTGKEYIEVECEQYFDLVGKKTWYEHNGIKYDERTMNDYEIAKIKQGSLLGDGANAMDAARIKHSKAHDNHDDGEFETENVVNGPF